LNEYFNSWHVNFSLFTIEHAKDALDLAQVQETTKQLEKQEKIKVHSLTIIDP
jgi:hypothetical protein